MAKKINNVINRINFWILIVLAILVPITFFINWVCIFKLNSTFSFKIHQYLSYILPIEIGIYIYKLITREHRIDIFDILTLLLIAFGIISIINAIVPKVAIWGSSFRFEGFVQIATYYLLFLNSRYCFKKEEIIKLINVFIIIGLAQFVYSVLQVFVRGSYIYVKTEYVSYRASGFIGHPNMLGSFTILMLLISLGMYLLYDKNKKFYLISSIILYMNLILTESTGPFLGFIAALIFMFIFLKVKKLIDLKKILIIIGSCIALLFLVSYCNKISSEKRFGETYQNKFSIIGDIKDTSKAIISLVLPESKKFKLDSVTDRSEVEKMGSYRVWIWKLTLKMVPKYIWTGCGVDNYYYAVLELEESATSMIDKAHNEYLQLLLTQGIFALITYISLLVLVFIRGLKSKDTLVWILMFAFIGFSAQAFFNISVYNVAPFFFITMGFLVGLTNKEKLINEK